MFTLRLFNVFSHIQKPLRHPSSLRFHTYVRPNQMSKSRRGPRGFVVFCGLCLPLFVLPFRSFGAFSVSISISISLLSSSPAFVAHPPYNYSHFIPLCSVPFQLRVSHCRKRPVVVFVAVAIVTGSMNAVCK